MTRIRFQQSLEDLKENLLVMAGLAEQAERERAAEAERARQEIREERVRIARELHDVVAHTLAVITVQASGIRMSSSWCSGGSAMSGCAMTRSTSSIDRMFLGSVRPSRGSSISDAGLCRMWFCLVSQRNHTRKGTRYPCWLRKVSGSPFFLR